MSNLLATLGNSAGALDVFERVLGVTQNNVANASTPGYAKQSLQLEAMPLDLAMGSLGGVRSGATESARDEYSERAVRQQTTGVGYAQQNVSSLTAIQSLFDVSGKTGIEGALNNLYQSFSAWGQNPSDGTARQAVIDRATTVAASFQQTAAGLASVQKDTESQLKQTVDSVNQLVAKLQGYNSQIMQFARTDPGMDAQLHTSLEELSKFVDVTAIHQEDGTVTVLLNDETPLLVADRAYTLGYSLTGPDAAAKYPDAPPSAHISASDGRDITGKCGGGQLGALLNVHNQVLPSYLGGATQPGDLNTMAEQFADRVNQILTAGYVTDHSDGTDGSTPQAGVALFQYATAPTMADDGTVQVAAQHTRVAQTLIINPAITAGQLAAVMGTPTALDVQPVLLTQEVSNGVPLALAALANPADGQDMVNGTTSYLSFFGGMAGRVGTSLNDASDQLEVRQSSMAQAKDLRQQVSGVSLDEQAMVMIQFQRAYDANSRMITILNQITQDAINILQP